MKERKKKPKGKEKETMDAYLLEYEGEDALAVEGKRKADAVAESPEEKRVNAVIVEYENSGGYGENELLVVMLVEPAHRNALRGRFSEEPNRHQLFYEEAAAFSYYFENITMTEARENFISVADGWLKWGKDFRDQTLEDAGIEKFSDQDIVSEPEEEADERPGDEAPDDAVNIRKRIYAIGPGQRDIYSTVYDILWESGDREGMIESFNQQFDLIE